MLSYYNSQEKANERTRIEKAGSVSFFKKFTGNVVETHIESGKSIFYAYVNGLKQEKPTVLSSGAIGARPAGNCDWEVCEWGMACPDGYYPMAIGVAHTEGEGACDPPVGITLECGYLTIYRLNWSYIINGCSGDEGDGGGIDPGEDGGTGTPVPRIPCKQMLLLSQSAFQMADASLQSKVTGNRETAYTFTDSNDQSGYMYSEGNANEHFMEVKNPFSLGGTGHNHFAGGLPIFSGTDLQYIYQLVESGVINSPYSYVDVLITHNGVDYSLHITDLVLFKQFGEQYLSTDYDVAFFEKIFYLSKQNSIAPTTSIAAAEKQFLIAIYGKGLSLTRRNRAGVSPNTWQQIVLNNGEVQTLPCN